MGGHFLKAATRNLVKHRLYTAINVGGLAIGLAASVLILLFVRDELTFDAWIPAAESIYRLETTHHLRGEDTHLGLSPGLVKPALDIGFAENFEAATRIARNGAAVTLANGDKVIESFSVVDPEFFEVFALPLREGAHETALLRPNSLILSPETARRFFGDGPYLGRTIPMEFGGGAEDYEVTAVLEETPQNTNFPLRAMIYFDAKDFADQPWIANSWLSINLYTFIRFLSDAQRQGFERGIANFYDGVAIVNIAGEIVEKPSEVVELNLMPMLDIHLNSNGRAETTPVGSWSQVLGLSALAAFILILAAINAVNLATAMAAKKGREVSLRKLMGASRNQLIWHYLGESFLLTGFAMLLAVAIVELTLPAYNAFLDRVLVFTPLVDLDLSLGLLGIGVLVAILSGLYPALYLSAIRPGRILGTNRSETAGTQRLRASLVVFQFAISIALTIVTGVVLAQISYANSRPVGFETESRIILSNTIFGGEATGQVMREKIAALQGVTGVTRQLLTPPMLGDMGIFFDPPGGGEPIYIQQQQGDWGYFGVYGTPFVAGRDFSPDRRTDLLQPPSEDGALATQSIILSKKAVRALGFDTPEEAVGQVMSVGVNFDNPEERTSTTIIGVVEDVQFRTARNEARGRAYMVRDEGMGTLTIAVRSEQMVETVGAIERIWSQHITDLPIRIGFLDDRIEALYNQDRQLGTLLALFAGLAITVSSLGLFGMATFAAERRTKEIGIRKVMGARVADIVRLLVWQFSKPVLIANLIAWPAALWFARDWLSEFAYRIPLSPTFFVGAGLLALTIAWVTVAGQAWRVARANPVHALRYE